MAAFPGCSAGSVTFCPFCSLMLLVLSAFHHIPSRTRSFSPTRSAHELFNNSLRITWAMEEVPQPKKQIACTRSFGRVVESLADLKESVAFYVSRAAEKLREQHSLTSILGVFIQTNPFATEKPQYSRSCTIRLAAPTNDTSELIGSALRAVEKLYLPGYQYHRAGIFLQELVQDTYRQLRLFTPTESITRPQTVVEVLDAINQRFGRETIRYAATGRERGWKMRQEHRSPHYTTNLAELPQVW